MPADWQSEFVSLEFEGIFHYSMIYLNGVLLTNHSCGYTSFDVPLPTSLLKFGQPNTLAVFTDATSGTGWWYEGGGIYRHVWLVKRPAVHFASWGTFVSASVNPGSIRHGEAGLATTLVTGAASINVSTVISAAASAPSTRVGVIVDVFDPSAAVVATFISVTGATVSGGAEVSVVTLGQLNVTLWTIRSPTLYTVRTRLIGSDGEVLDEANTTTGFRHLHYDSSNGFQMNNNEVKVRGFCDHNDFASVGTAVPDRINLYRAQAARSVGGNGRRTSHNPPNPSMLDIYDRVGVVVMAENRDFFPGQQYYDNMADLVRRDRNHPAVVIWCAFPTRPFYSLSIWGASMATSADLPRTHPHPAGHSATRGPARLVDRLVLLGLAFGKCRTNLMGHGRCLATWLVTSLKVSWVI